MMLDLVVNAVGITEKGYDTVIDSVMFNFLLKYFKHGIDLNDKHIEVGVKMRMILDANCKNVDALNAIKFYEIKHIDGIKGNLGITDGIYYRASAKSTETAPPPLLICSTLRALLEQQQYFFDMLWRKAVPAKRRIKEIEEGLKREFIETIQDPKETRLNS